MLKVRFISKPSGERLQIRQSDSKPSQSIIVRIPRLHDRVAAETARYWTTIERHKLYIAEHGDDLPEVRDWQWTR